MSGLPYLWSHLTFMLVMTGGFVAVCVACGAILDRSGAGLRSGSSVYRWRLLPAITLAALAFSWQLGSVMRGPVDLSGHLLALTGELSFGMLLFLGTMLAGRVFGSRWRVPGRGMQRSGFTWQPVWPCMERRSAVVAPRSTRGATAGPWLGHCSACPPWRRSPDGGCWPCCF